MKAAIVSVLALSLIGLSQAVTVTFYSDRSCTTPLPNLFDQQKFNPLVYPLNVCVQPAVLPTYWIKYTACAGSTATRSIYFDASCTNLASESQPPLGCHDSRDPGYGSISFTCSSVSPVTLALVSAVAAALLFCF
jgi:hypothetical protein